MNCRAASRAPSGPLCSPGPLLALSIREALKGGFWAGPAIATGHSLLELLVVIVLVLGLGPVFETTPVTAALSLGGGLFLLWMAWGMARVPGKVLAQLSGATDSQRRDQAQPLLNGAMVSLASTTTFSIGHILADYSWYSSVTLVVATGRRWITASVYRAVMVICGAFLAAMGGYFLFSGVQSLR
ncbi:MAG: LysE family transporter [Chloroflexi bacterium]|nr:LysE family transporter [Chloroflexota bacterium]